jgi:deoxyribodipyrimidine photo-lyase
VPAAGDHRRAGGPHRRRPGQGPRRLNRVVVLLNRDLRVHDHPALAEAARVADEVVPLFVLDDAVPAPPNRAAFLRDSLADLRASLRARGGDLVLRRGDTVREARRVVDEVEADAVFASADVSGFAQRRERELDVVGFPGVTVVPPDEVLTGSGTPYQVFTPYWRAWSRAPRRAVERAPRRLVLPPGLAVGRLPTRPSGTSPDLAEGGETVARRRVTNWGRRHLHEYEARHDDLPGDATSHLSPHLHLGTVSPLALADRLEDGAAFVRQLCWRDFHHQMTFHRPSVATEDLHPGRRRWRDDDQAFDAWAEGRTGLPIVDAGLRQLRQEGWMHNRARLLTASFLTKHLGIDWRRGAEHFAHWLVDGDLANNTANWQWVAGTGSDTRPNRILNPIRQAHRFDPDGTYVRRYVAELAAIPGGAVHEPWKLADPGDYPPPIVDHEAAAERFRRGTA